MNTPDALADLLVSIVQTSDAIYHNAGPDPLPDSIAATEVAKHDRVLEAATGTYRPVFGAYADAEAKLRVLNDLVRSFALIVADPTVNVGHIAIGRVVIETAGRTYWGLATSGDHTDRAGALASGAPSDHRGDQEVRTRGVWETGATRTGSTDHGRLGASRSRRPGSAASR